MVVMWSLCGHDGCCVVAGCSVVVMVSDARPAVVLMGVGGGGGDGDDGGGGDGDGVTVVEMVVVAMVVMAMVWWCRWW